MKPSPHTSLHALRNGLTARHVSIIGLIAGLIGLIYFLFDNYGVSDIGYFSKSSTHSLFQWMYERWLVDYRNTKFALSHWAPVISLALIWLDRRALSRLPCRVNYAGLVLVLFSFLLHWAGLKSEQTRISIISLIALTWSIPLFICGWPVAKRLLFPCGFLLFSIPLNFFDGLVQPIRLISAAITAGLLSGLGVTVTRSGPYIISPRIEGLRVNMADSANSIFVVIAVVAFALLCSYLVRATWKRRLLILVSAVPLFMLASMFRALLVMLIGTVVSGDVAQAFQHGASVPLFVLMSFGGIAALSVFLHRKAPHRLDTANQTKPTVRSGIGPLTALAISIAITAFATWWIPAHAVVVHREEAGVNLDLPSAIGDWRGGVVLFCHNPEQREQFFGEGQRPGDPCPTCGQPLQEMTEYEKKLLPPDTLVRKNWYTLEDKRRVHLSIVLSGKNRSSIHRPEVCLVGDGTQIAHSYIHPVELADGRVLNVKILEMLHPRKDAQGQTQVLASYYAYWFAGIDRETPHHLQRMIWMASDRMFKSQSYRWAYLSLSGGRTPGRTDYLAEVDTFLQLAYPHLVKNNDLPAGEEKR